MLKHKGKIIWKQGNKSVIDCTNCGFSHTKPIPKLEDLEKMYSHKFYQKLKPHYLKKDESENEYWNTTFDDKLDIFNKKIKKKNKKILDIGCGGGFFLHRAKKRKFNVLGIEPSSTAAAYARSNDIPIVESTFESFVKTNKEKFDVIHAKFFLEHIRDPIQTCKDCYRLLNSNGIICFTVPNDFNVLQKIITKELNKKPYWVVPSQHINYFSRVSLESLLKKTKFKPFLSEASFPLELFLLFGLNYLENNKIGKKIHSMRMNFESLLLSSQNNSLKRDLYSYFAEKGIGREITVYAKK